MPSSRPALRDLALTLDAPRRPSAALGPWRWTVRQQLVAVRELVLRESAQHDDSWLAARGGTILRERSALLARIASLAPQVLEAEDVSPVRVELKRLLADVARYLQRLHDLAYDEVELELGGSD